LYYIKEAALDPGTVLRKTAKGLEEMANRTFRLPQRARSVLIVVDGKLNLAAILQRTVDPAGSALLLDELVEQGFVESISTTATSEQAAPASAAEGSAVDLVKSRRVAASAVVDALGPDGEILAMQIEKCRSAEQLLDLLGRSQDIVRRVRGAKAADAFAQRAGLAP